MADQTTTYNQQPTAAPQPTQNQMPVGQLKTDRGLLKFILLSLVTLGIYALVFYAGISNDINAVASRYDGKKTMNYWLLFFLVGPLTLGIGFIVWNHKIAERIGNEARRRGIGTSFGASTFWLWNVLGSLIVVGPFIYIHKLADTMNEIAANYNVNG